MNKSKKHAERSKRNSHNTFLEPIMAKNNVGIFEVLYRRKLKEGR